MISASKPDLSRLNDIQLEMISKIKKYIQKNDAKKVSDDSHKHDAWLKTADYEKISYDFALEMDESFIDNWNYTGG